MPEDNEQLEEEKDSEVVDNASPHFEGKEATYHLLGESVIDQQFRNRILAFTILLIAAILVLIAAVIYFIAASQGHYLGAYITLGVGLSLLIAGLVIRRWSRNSRQKKGTDENMIQIGKDIYEASIEGLENRYKSLLDNNLIDNKVNVLSHHFTSIELIALLPSHLSSVSIIRHEVSLSSGSLMYELYLDSGALLTGVNLNLKNPGDTFLAHYLDELATNKDEMITPDDGLSALDDFTSSLDDEDEEESPDNYNSDNNFPDDPFLL